MGQEATKAPAIYSYVEYMPEAGVDLQKYFREHLEYPFDAIVDEMEGTVVLKLVVNEDGSLSDIHVIRSVATSIDSAAVRLVNKMPAWRPGKRTGKL